MNRQVILVSGFPKSGCTWLTRLLADVLNCPSGGSHPSEDRKEIAAEGQDRPGPYIIRKGHYRLFYPLAVPGMFFPIPKPHVLLPNYITDERLIFIIRDPRDIIVSACYHWKRKGCTEIIDLVCKGSLAKLPTWDEYLRQWQRVSNVKWTSYEKLSDNPFNEVLFLLAELDYDKARIIPAIQRQSFTNRKKQIEQEGDDLYLGKKYNLQFMRKGIVGDYKNFLTGQEQEHIWDCLGGMMEKQGYNG